MAVGTYQHRSEECSYDYDTRYFKVGIRNQESTEYSSKQSWSSFDYSGKEWGIPYNWVSTVYEELLELALISS